MRTLICLILSVILWATAVPEAEPVTDAADVAVEVCPTENPLDIVPALDAFAEAERNFWPERMALLLSDIEAEADACVSDAEALLGRLDDATDFEPPTDALRGLLVRIDGRREEAFREFGW